MLTPEEIKANYAKMADYEIENLAKKPKGLRKEIIPVLNDEIIRRGLDLELISWIADETNEFSETEIEKLKDKIERCKCPKCETNKEKIIGFEFQQMTSFILGSYHENYYLFACTDCRKKIRRKNLLVTFLGGWWSVGGIFGTPVKLLSILINSIFGKRKNDFVVRDFVSKNTAFLRRMKTPEELDSLLKSYNHENSKEYLDMPEDSLM
ncbi:MAG: hypothetical protein LBE36_11180 [Flavobacteriaceae bacterium]|jgi:hypothetical protein|nr:hypothetical protein [Flavobacteriaceae bacterium]